MGTTYTECITGFEAKRRLAENGMEYWMARELMPLLDYAAWRNFCLVIDKAKVACESSGVLSKIPFCWNRQYGSHWKWGQPGGVRHLPV